MTDSNLSQQNMRGPSFMNISNDDKQNNTKSSQHQHTEECNHTVNQNPQNIENNKSTKEKLREKLREKLATKRLQRLNRGSLQTMYDKHTNQETDN
jgi:hypothetical protein